MSTGVPAVGTVAVARLAGSIDSVRLMTQPSAAVIRSGHYVLNGIAPGRYVVIASNRPRTNPLAPSGATASRGAEASAAWLSYYPDALLPTAARALDLTSSQHLSGVDILIPEESAAGVAVAGQVVGLAEVAGDVRVRLLLQDSSVDVPPGFEVAGVPLQADGRFAFAKVPPGSYKIAGLVPTSGSPDSPDDSWFSSDLNVADKPLTNLEIRAQGGTRVHGRVFLESSTTQSMPLPGAITVRSLDGWDLQSLGTAAVNRDGTFVTAALPAGRYSVLPNSPAGLRVESEKIGQKDVLFQGVETTAGDVEGLAIALSAHLGGIEGMIHDAGGRPKLDATLFVFPAIPESWHAESVVELRPGSDGHVNVSLPSGVYCAVAVTGPIPPRWNERELLRRLSERCKGIQVTMGVFKSVEIPVVSIR